MPLYRFKIYPRSILKSEALKSETMKIDVNEINSRHGLEPMSGFLNPYLIVDESTFNFRVIPLCMTFPVRKQYILCCDAAFWGISSGGILFACLETRTPDLYAL